MKTIINSLLLAGLVSGSPLFSSTALADSAIDSAMAHAGRSEADHQRDARSKPEATLALLGVKPGDKVIDLFAGGGYYSELLAYLVGDEGSVVAFNNPPYIAFDGKKMQERLKDQRLPQVSQYEAKVAEFAPQENHFDSALMILSFHDLYWHSEKYHWPVMDAGAFLSKVNKSLKPGGRVLVVDHAAEKGHGSDDVMAMHRIDEAFVVDRFKENGFKLVATSDALRNPQDPHNIDMSDPEIRGKTDRFVLVFEK